MSKYQQFIFDTYVFDKAKKQLDLCYSLDDQLNFTESYHFDFDFADYDEAVLDRAIQTLFFMAGVSYYKTYLPPQIAVRQGTIDTLMAQFLGKTYQRGLGEFFYVNSLDSNTQIAFPATMQAMQPVTHKGAGQLVGLGGGKDSLVTIELLRPGTSDLATWSAGHRPQLTPLVERIGLPHFWVERTWDRKLLEVNQQDAYNGHVPISGVLGCVGIVTAVLAGKRDIVVSNEQSANEPTMGYQGVNINHQYSKSQEFERDFQALLSHQFGDSLRYYSLLRPFSELRIAELFAGLAFEKYKDVFSSCNRAFTHTSDRMSWCGECPKCAFTFLILTPFVAQPALEVTWNKNLLLDATLEPTYRQLLGIEGDKPLECVGEIRESRFAMRLSQEQYPTLKDKYVFDLPPDYNFRKLSSHELPDDIYQVFTKVLAKLQPQPGQHE